jgi:hypothetical protein
MLLRLTVRSPRAYRRSMLRVAGALPPTVPRPQRAWLSPVTRRRRSLKQGISLRRLLRWAQQRRVRRRRRRVGFLVKPAPWRARSGRKDKRERLRARPMRLARRCRLSGTHGGQPIVGVRGLRTSHRRGCSPGSVRGIARLGSNPKPGGATNDPMALSRPGVLRATRRGFLPSRGRVRRLRPGIQAQASGMRPTDKRYQARQGLAPVRPARPLQASLGTRRGRV